MKSRTRNQIQCPERFLPSLIPQNMIPKLFKSPKPSLKNPTVIFPNSYSIIRPPRERLFARTKGPQIKQSPRTKPIQNKTKQTPQMPKRPYVRSHGIPALRMFFSTSKTPIVWRRSDYGWLHWKGRCKWLINNTHKKKNIKRHHMSFNAARCWDWACCLLILVTTLMFCWPQ